VGVAFEDGVMCEVTSASPRRSARVFHMMRMQTFPRLSERIIEDKIFQCNFARAVGRETSARGMHDAKNENEATMQGASILGPTLLGSACDRICDAGFVTRRN
jgi:hypothetical protein